MILWAKTRLGIAMPHSFCSRSLPFMHCAEETYPTFLFCRDVEADQADYLRIVQENHLWTALRLEMPDISDNTLGLSPSK
jgi:hypothetical protein